MVLIYSDFTRISNGKRRYGFITEVSLCEALDIFATYINVRHPWIVVPTHRRYGSNMDAEQYKNSTIFVSVK